MVFPDEVVVEPEALVEPVEPVEPVFEEPVLVEPAADEVLEEDEPAAVEEEPEPAEVLALPEPPTMLADVPRQLLFEFGLIELDCDEAALAPVESMTLRVII